MKLLVGVLVANTHTQLVVARCLPFRPPWRATGVSRARKVWKVSPGASSPRPPKKSAKVTKSRLKSRKQWGISALWETSVACQGFQIFSLTTIKALSWGIHEMTWLHTKTRTCNMNKGLKRSHSDRPPCTSKSLWGIQSSEIAQGRARAQVYTSTSLFGGIEEVIVSEHTTTRSFVDKDSHLSPFSSSFTTTLSLSPCDFTHDPAVSDPMTLATTPNGVFLACFSGNALFAPQIPVVFALSVVSVISASTQPPCLWLSK